MFFNQVIQLLSQSLILVLDFKVLVCLFRELNTQLIDLLGILIV